jgi:hypothetical protein
VSNNEKITDTAYGFANGAYPAPAKPGLCLQLVRLIIETALQLQPFTLYHGLERVERAPGDDTDPWARDLERTHRNRGWAILQPEAGKRYVHRNDILELAPPGSILHRWDAAKTPAGTFIGHVGILLHGGLVIENVSPLYRKRSFQSRANPNLHLTPIADFPTTLVTNYRA